MNKLYLLLIISIVLGICQSFTPSKNTYFFEDFQSGPSKWVKTTKFETGETDIRTSDDSTNPADKGLVLTQEARHYALTSKLVRPLSNKDTDLVIQYEVQLQNGLDCGGAYIKLYTASDNLEADSIEKDTPYSIMFGPDKCGHESKIHFIVRQKNPVTGKYEEKHLTNRPPIRTDKIHHLYTLHIKPDNTYSLLVDGQSVQEGSLHENFTPSFTPPKEIDDVTDIKPSDWVDDAQIPDPEATKPEDWDEDQPARIPDPEATKPDDWLDNEPEFAPSDEAKPEEWNDEEDGEWEAPMVPNPKCEAGNCGEWKAPLIQNPLYKGKWSAPLIDNPAFKGVWAPRKVPNPEYFEAVDPYIVESIGAVGIEVWTMSKGITFDNFIITTDKAEADAFAQETFYPRHNLEKEAQSAKEAEENAKLNPTESWVEFANRYAELIVEYSQANPLVVAVSASALVIPIIFLMTRSSPKKQPVASSTSPATTTTTTTTTTKKPVKKEESSEEEGSEEEEEKEKEDKKKSSKTSTTTKRTKKD
eukprot:gene508-640_t